MDPETTPVALMRVSKNGTACSKKRLAKLVKRPLNKSPTPCLCTLLDSAKLIAEENAIEHLKASCLFSFNAAKGKDNLIVMGVDELERRKAKRATYEHPLQNGMLLTFVFDGVLQEGIVGITKTPLLVFKRAAATKEYVNVGDADVGIVQMTINE
ncbi:hypothetical protein L210DRAFT_3509120 [Boletus edulis BED1]|uniref:Uncharacterized protein n=1 Tax=Boletus edulis BED1 TaxID=1328754 RepID=A0AAD4BFN7_BOLED|nr:hypothetical protein L210DRAFT_3509120 [Boletus edulis BED1]